MSDFAEIQLLYDTSARMGSALDVESVVTAYLMQVAAGERYACTITLYEDESGTPYPEPRKRARVRILGAWRPESGLSLQPRFHPYMYDGLDPTLDAGETVAIADVRTDPRVTPTLRRMQEDSGRPALALIPLMAHGDLRIGLVVLSAPEPQGWTTEDLRRYQITAAHLAASLDARLQQRLLYDWGLHLAVFEERRRLARELHDSVTQLLFSINLISESLPAAWKRDPAEGERRADHLRDLAGAALSEMRQLLAELRPVEGAAAELPSTAIAPKYPATRGGPAASAGEGAFAAALNALAWRYRGVSNVHITVEADGCPEPAPALREAALRIASEALANVIKHARARTARLSVTTQGGPLHLIVSDDGSGFDVRATPTRHGGLGLSTMRERAEAVGGVFSVASASGVGTTIEVMVPL